MFCIFAQPEIWKWASSLKNTSSSGGRSARGDSQAVWRALKITFSELLHYCHFVWTKAKFFVKASSHSAVRNPQDSCMYASRTSGQTHKRPPPRINIFGCSDALCRSLVFFSTLLLTLNVFTHKAYRLLTGMLSSSANIEPAPKGTLSCNNGAAI